jgi:hypothetical protein
MLKMRCTAGCVLILLGMLLTPPLAAGPLPTTPTGVSVRSGRLLLNYPHHAPVAVAGVSNASEPCLSPDKRHVAFIKAVPGAKIDTGSGSNEPNQLWVLDTTTRKASCLVKSHSADDMTRILAGLSHLEFSPDGREVFFQSSAWAVSDAVHAVSLATQHIRFVCDGNSFTFIRRGHFRGMLLVEKHKYHSDERGAYDAAWVVTPSGRELKRWDNKEL